MYKYVVASLGALVASVLIVCLFAIPPKVQLPEVPWDDERGSPSDYPVNLEMHSVQDDLTFVHKVYYDMREQSYVYYYRIEYEGVSVALFSWEVLNMQGEQVPFMAELVPGQKYEFTFKSPSPPMMFEGYVGLFFKQSDGHWVGKALEPQTGPIPSLNYPEKTDEPESNESID